MLEVDKNIRAHIGQTIDVDKILETGKEQGLKLMVEDGVSKMKAGSDEMG